MSQTQTDPDIVYYPMTAELVAKAKKFGYNNRKRYIVKDGNPFGYRGGIAFTGAGLKAVVSKSVVNFMKLNDPDKGEFGKAWNELYDYINTVVKAIARETVISANGMGHEGCFETPFDVESSTSVMLCHEFFYDKDKKLI